MSPHLTTGSGVAVTPRLADPARLRVLEATGLQDGPAVENLDRFTALAARVIGAPVSLVSLVDAGRQFFASAVGLPEPWAVRRETPLTHSFCQYVVAADAPLVISDARADEFMCTNLAIPDIGVIAYAGFPLRSPDGQTLGSFCVIDTKPRVWTDADLATIQDLAHAVEAEIAVRLSHAALMSETQRTRVILDAATDAFVTADSDGRIRAWNDTAERLFGWAAAEVMGRSLSETIIPERFRAAHEAGLARIRGTGVSELLGRRLELAAINRWNREFPIELVLQTHVHDHKRLFHAFLHDISERHRVRSELEQERTFLTSLLDSLDTGVAACDAEGRLVLSNPAFRRAHGLVGAPATHDDPALGRLYAADGNTPLPPEEAPLARAFAGEVVHQSEIVLRGAESSPRRFLANGRPIRTVNGSKLGAVVALHDITLAARADRMRAVQHAVSTVLADASSAAEAAMRTAAAVAQGLNWACGEYWQIAEDESVIARVGTWVADAHELSGFASPEDLSFPCGLGLAGHVWEAGRQLWITDLDDLDSAWFTRRAAARRAGLRSATGLPVRSGDRILGVLAFFNDHVVERDEDLQVLLDGVSAHLGRFVERRRAEDLVLALAAARRDFERVVAGIQDYIWTNEVLADGTTRSVYASSNAAGVFGGEVPAGVDRAAEIGVLTHPDDMPAYRRFTAAIEAGEAAEMETRLIGYDGVTRWIWTRAVARREGGRLLIDGICTDVTERHQLAQEREDLLARRKDQVRQLRELDRMKDELVALVTHELRSPVTSIRGYLELVLDQPEALNAQTLRFLSIVDRKAADLLQLTDDLLDLARLDAGHVTVELRPTSLTRLLHETVNGHLPAADAKHLLLDLRIADNLLVHADPGRLRQVLDNLLSNAVKYTPDGGRVTLTATADTATASVVIADTGIGIPAEEYPRLFERFFRTSNALREGIKGTGLGLSITKAIVEEHGGSITARANIPSGTVFTITLPANGLEPSPE